jgi:hypothetical protein
MKTSQTHELRDKTERTEVQIVLPPSIIPVFFIKGSDYQMGYQYGRQAGKYIEWMKTAGWVKALKHFASRQEVINEFKSSQYFTRECAPEAIDMMKGMADGAKDSGYEVDYTDILMLNTRVREPTPTAAYPDDAKREAIPPEEGCSN